MQDFLYFCSVKRGIFLIVAVLWGRSLTATPSPLTVTLDDIIGDIYHYLMEISEVDYEQLQTDLYALHEAPIDLNATSEEELRQLYFLSPKQIDDILLYADKHPFETLYELRMIPSLEDYDIRNLLPFVRVCAPAQNNNIYAREVFTQAKHELIARVDARNIEGFEGTDPMFVQTRYRFDYQRKVVFGAQLRRPAGGAAQSLQYGAYMQLRDIAPHVHTVVGGNFQASFGQGLVLAPVFHSGKSAYVSSVGQQANGLRYYSSADGQGLHGAGGTVRWEWNNQTRLDVSALYSMQKANDSTWHHLVGANVTIRHKRLEVQLTAIENIWSDSIRPYRNAAYNQHYFRGTNQAVAGASVRYNHGWFDLFGEVAASENRYWGYGGIVGSRFYPTSGVSLIALYRYYSPWFDNALGYAFSESSRIGDENGGYIGIDITRFHHSRILGYGDVFYFTGPKYGLPESPSLGYDAMLEAQYHGKAWWTSLRLRAKQKGSAIYSARAQFDWTEGGWSMRTTVDANIVKSEELRVNSIPYGVSLAQDVAYSFAGVPLSLRVRLQGFDARNWGNRIYMYEHDVLYSFSIPATYGAGGRAYLCMRWQIIPQLALYLRVSETVYAKKWASEHNRSMTRTDVHFLLRASL